MALGAGGSKAGSTGGDAAPTSLGPGGKTPAMRQQEHADKKRQFDARRSMTPGPGSYTPAKPTGDLSSSSSKKGSVGGSASFASKSKRISSDKVDDKGDPGSYDPYLLKELAITSKKSASKANRSGQGAFGAKQQRKMNIDIMGEATPGPGSYNGAEMMKNGKKAALSAFDTGERMPSSAFKSKSAQREKAQNEHVPGAGAYSPNFSAQDKNATNPGASMKAKGTRFKTGDSWERAQKLEPGPGAYEIEYLRSGTKSALASRASASSSKEIAFSSDALRELPWEQ